MSGSPNPLLISLRGWAPVLWLALSSCPPPTGKKEWGRVWRCGVATGGPRRSGLQGCLLGIGSKEKYNNHAPPSLFVLHLSRGFTLPQRSVATVRVCMRGGSQTQALYRTRPDSATGHTYSPPQLSPTHLYAYIKRALEHTHGDATQDEAIYILIYMGEGWRGR